MPYEETGVYQALVVGGLANTLQKEGLEPRKMVVSLSGDLVHYVRMKPRSVGFGGFWLLVKRKESNHRC